MENFDSKQLVFGLVEHLETMEDELFEFCFYLTFTKAFKAYRKDFYDFDNCGLDDMSFFKDVDDPIVQHCFRSFIAIKGLKCYLMEAHRLKEIRHYWKIQDYEQLNKRLRVPHYHKKRKSYIKLKHFYELYLEAMARSLYFYTCYLTAKDFVIPLAMRNGFFAVDSNYKLLLDLSDDDIKQIVLTFDQLQIYLDTIS